VTTDASGDIVFREPDSFTELRRISAEGGSTRGGLAFSDDGRYLVGNQDGKGRLWDVATGEQIGQPIDALRTILPLAFPGEVAGLVSGTEDHIEIWRFDPSTWVDIACRAAGRNLTRAEWAQYGPRDTTYRTTCPQWPIEA
jgi:hypothetical protein